ncbi:hypothetical protein OG905_01805 [Streptomyces sp. NBC_00322]|uniref:hypothetical protein n=1 Tax=Streptomyces sp. NBC_00322 TaxID=2975712 RepID=UPI002E296589|nr:hypothetical protein [Streptomyces sp. NBC_00322]
MQTRILRSLRRPLGVARSTVLFAVGTTAVAVLTGCGGGSTSNEESGGNDVASLPTRGTEGSAAKPSPADPDAGRPQIRLDSTQDDVNRMMDSWLACLNQHGGPDALKQYKRNPNTATGRACQSKLPLDPPELDPAKNPRYNDDVREMIQCMNGKGFKSEVSPDGHGWALVHGSDLNAPGFEKAERPCLVKAFGGDN